jgi:hypothetical protein
MVRTIINKTTDDAYSRDWNNSRPLDVHSWSDYPEVNSFIDGIYSQYFTDINRNTRIAKKHIKKVLLDLYVAWIDDPDLNISVHMRKESYSNGSAVDQGRYNVLNIKASTIKVIHRLIEVDLIGFKKGKEKGEGYERGFISRIWSTPKLINLFEKVRFGIFDIGYNDSRLVLVLNKTIKEKVNGKTKRRVELIEYEPDKLPLKVKKMEQVVNDYNALLERTFIDIGDAETYRVLIPATKKRKNKNKEVFVNITHHSKFTHRVFNNGNWKQGGRFYGGWWQRVGSDIREKILIDNHRTVEVDWSALHPILAYGKKGIEYKDKYPYDIAVQFVDELGIENPDVSKTVVKLLTLMGLNASDESSLFQAFRGEFYKTAEWQIIKSVSSGYKITNKKLKIVLEDIKEKHSPIADMFNTGVGLDFMYLDSQIVEYVMKKFIERDEPVLQVYDSFIVRQTELKKLIDCMYEGFYEVTGKRIISIKQLQECVITRTQVNAFKHIDFDYWLDNHQQAEPEFPETCEGYKRRFNRHFKHYFKKENTHSKFVMYNEILDASNKKLYEEEMLKEFKKLQDKPNE